MARKRSAAAGKPAAGDSGAAVLRELVAHLRRNRTPLREEWARRITDAELLTALTQAEIFSEATSVYDNYVEVLETGSVEALQDYARNRDLLLQALSGLGIRRIAPPDGAFYLYADVGDLTRDSLAFCRELLDATGVALNTGRDFDRVHGDRFVRISFAVSTAETLRAIECLEPWLERRKRA